MRKIKDTFFSRAQLQLDAGMLLQRLVNQQLYMNFCKWKMLYLDFPQCIHSSARFPTFRLPFFLHIFRHHQFWRKWTPTFPGKLITSLVDLKLQKKDSFDLEWVFWVYLSIFRKDGIFMLLEYFFEYLIARINGCLDAFQQRYISSFHKPALTTSHVLLTGFDFARSFGSFKSLPEMSYYSCVSTLLRLLS